MLRARAIGYLVPAPSFAGTVHSVFAHACNVDIGVSLIAILADGGAESATALVLDVESDIDLRRTFAVGDALVRRNGWIASRGGVVNLATATVWRPTPAPPMAARAQVVANLREVASRLAARSDLRRSVVHRQGRDVCARLQRACADGDIDRATDVACRLIGWGEGSTPSGDDFLIGLLAGLDVPASSARTPFRATLCESIAAQTHRTVAIAAHELRLAAAGHFGARLLALRDALLSSTDVARLTRLADDALTVGATSGADTVAGLIAGLSAALGHETAFAR